MTSEESPPYFDMAHDPDVMCPAYADEPVILDCYLVEGHTEVPGGRGYYARHWDANARVWFDAAPIPRGSDQ